MKIQENTFYYWLHSTKDEYIIYQLSGRKQTYFYKIKANIFGDNGGFLNAIAEQCRIATDEEKLLLIPYLKTKGINIELNYEIY